MEPKKNTPRIIWIKSENNPQIDPEMAAWLDEYLTKFLSDQGAFDWSGDHMFPEYMDDLNSDPTLDTAQELADLERLDAQVQGEDLPDTLAMIMSAVQRVRDNG